MPIRRTSVPFSLRLLVLKTAEQIFFEHWGDNLQFYPDFALFSTLEGMNLDQDSFQVSKLSEDQKKGLHQKWNTFSPNSGEDQKKRSPPEMEYFFSPNSGEDQKKGNTFLITDLRSDAHQTQIIGGDADESHTQIVGGYTVKLLGGYIPPWFWHHCVEKYVELNQSTTLDRKKPSQQEQTFFNVLFFHASVSSQLHEECIWFRDAEGIWRHSATT